MFAMVIKISGFFFNFRKQCLFNKVYFHEIVFELALTLYKICRKF